MEYKGFTLKIWVKKNLTKIYRFLPHFFIRDFEQKQSSHNQILVCFNELLHTLTYFCCGSNAKRIIEIALVVLEI